MELKAAHFLYQHKIAEKARAEQQRTAEAKKSMRQRLRDLPPQGLSNNRNATLQPPKIFVIHQTRASEKPYTKRQKIRQSVVDLQLLQVVVLVILHHISSSQNHHAQPLN
jgi:hypothetical protein